MPTTKDASQALRQRKRKKTSLQELKDRHGIETVATGLGKDRKGRWWGWSHRAIHDFATRQQAERFAESVS